MHRQDYAGGLTAEYAAEVKGMKVATIALWDRNKTAQQNLLGACDHLPDVANDPRPISERVVFFVIDEARITYSLEDLWSSHLKTSSRTGSPTKYLLLSCYGSHSQWKMDLAAPTPIHIPVEAQVFLQAPSLPGLACLSLSVTWMRLLKPSKCTSIKPSRTLR